ncbi:MAG: PLP-dependent aminotransferase family protein [Bacteroidales bacterium]|nr:PLP-dependent aminotransferase family protein [Bacteroidales bacterium]
MLPDINGKLSRAAKSMKRSAIREILKLLQNPEMISFAGGLPAPESFPVDEVREITSMILETQGKSALQYGTTEGDPFLREMILKRHKAQGLTAGQENLAISTGSQQALDILGKLLIDPGDHVICGLPSYLGGLSAFNIYGAKMEGIPFDDRGMRVDELEKTMKQLVKDKKKPKFIYVIPDFQNPAGITMPDSRRTEILKIASEYDLLVVEDSPYRDLRFEGKAQTLMYSLDTEGRVITLFTFSKIFAPGFRIAWLLGNPEIINKFFMAKQSADLCSPVLVQKIIAEYMSRGLLEKNLVNTISLYKSRRDHMLSCFEKYMPEGVTWTKPEGGLFLFIRLPENADADEIFKLAVENNVAFVRGSVFYCNDCGKNTMRINFSYCDTDTITKGVKRLAGVINDYMQGMGRT